MATRAGEALLGVNILVKLFLRDAEVVGHC